MTKKSLFFIIAILVAAIFITFLVSYSAFVSSPSEKVSGKVSPDTIPPTIIGPYVGDLCHYHQLVNGMTFGSNVEMWWLHSDNPGGSGINISSVLVWCIDKTGFSTPLTPYSVTSSGGSFVFPALSLAGGPYTIKIRVCDMDTNCAETTADVSVTTSDTCKPTIGRPYYYTACVVSPFQPVNNVTFDKDVTIFWSHSDNSGGSCRDSGIDKATGRVEYTGPNGYEDLTPSATITESGGQVIFPVLRLVSGTYTIKIGVCDKKSPSPNCAEVTATVYVKATPISCGQTLPGSLNIPGEQNFYTFTANAGDAVTIRLIRTSGVMTPNLELYDSTGQLIGSDLPSTGNSAKIDKVFSTRGTYTLVVFDNGNNDIGGYNLIMQRWNIPCSVPTLTCGQTVSSSLDAGEQDFYTFAANAGDNVVLTLTRTSGDLDPGLDAYDSSGNPIDSDHPGSGDTATVTLSNLNGTYFAVVSDTGNDESGDYTLNLKNLKVTVTAPNGGEDVGGSSIQKITWDSGNSQCISSQNIYLSTNGGSSFTPITTNLTADVQSYDWTIPANLSTSSAKIRVMVIDDAGNGVQDDSDANFTIHVPTSVGGVITSNTVWTPAGSPYIVASNLTIRNNATLTITTTTSGGEAPVEVRFNEGKGLRIGITTNENEMGRLIAEGTKNNPITFTTNTPGQYWSGILFNYDQSTTSTASTLRHCVIEYAGHPRDPDTYPNLDGAISFWRCVPNYNTNPVTYCTIRNSMTDGVRINSTLSGSGILYHCNIYDNARYDYIDYENSGNHSIDISYNYWGTPLGPSYDLCTPAVVSSEYLNPDKLEPWLEREFTEPLRFKDPYSVTAREFSAPGESTTINFTVSKEVKWTLSILNQQFEKVWFAEGNTTVPNQSVTSTWDGKVMFKNDDNVFFNGDCYYHIEATSNTYGEASPAMGHLKVGTQAIALITEPLSQSLYSPGIHIPIVGTAIVGSGGYYEVKYGVSGDPTSWTTIERPVYEQKENATLKTWDTTGLDQDTYTIRLDVHNGTYTYSDRVTIKFVLETLETPPSSPVTYTYDNQRRLKKITYPDESSIEYTYDRVGNRQTVATEKKSSQSPRRPIRLAYFKAKPTRKGVLLAWKTGSNVNASGFNIYRKGSEEGSYEKVNPSLIRAKGDGASGAEYSLTDVPLKMGRIWYYQLEIVETTGKTRRYGPIQSRNIAIGSTKDKGGSQKSFNVNCD
jgi:YD repeat-containing protein